MRTLFNDEIQYISGAAERPYFPIIAGGILGGSCAAFGFYTVLAVTEHYFLGNALFRHYVQPFVQGTPIIMAGGLLVSLGMMGGFYVAENYYSS
jgi:hypothetical protein